MRHADIAIRYSLLTSRRAKNWKIGRGDYDQYRAQLLSDERMRQRFSLFSNVTLPSLVALYERKPSDISMTVRILAAAELSNEAKSAIEKAVETHNFIKIHYIDSDISNYAAIAIADATDFEVGDLVASIRLDDDDALSHNFLHHLSPYIESQFDGFVVSLSKGYAAQTDGKGKIIRLKEYRWPFASVGQAVISRLRAGNSAYSVYDCGNHRMTDIAFPTIIDSRDVAFARTFHETNDSEESFEHQKGAEVLNSKRKSALALFGLASTGD